MHFEQSSLIKDFNYDADTKELTIYFVDKYYKENEIYVDVEPQFVVEFLEADSLGKFYLSKIQYKLKQKTEIMADKFIQASIDLSKIKKEWLVQGSNVRDDGSVGIFMNITILYKEQQDQYGQNGFIVQKVPKEVYQADKTVKGPILGNCKEFENKPKTEVAVPGEATGKNLNQDIADDLPF
jgi:hypothetical protein